MGDPEKLAPERYEALKLTAEISKKNDFGVTPNPCLFLKTKIKNYVGDDVWKERIQNNFLITLT